MLLGQLFNLEARAVTVAIHRAEDDIRTAQTSLQTVDSIPQVTAVIVKLPTAPLNKGTVERFHPLYPANDKHALATKLKGRTPLIARSLPATTGRTGSSKVCLVFPVTGRFFPFASLPYSRFTASSRALAVILSGSSSAFSSAALRAALSLPPVSPRA